MFLRCKYGPKLGGGPMYPQNLHFFLICMTVAAKIDYNEFKKRHILMYNLISDRLGSYPGL